MMPQNQHLIEYLNQFAPQVAPAATRAQAISDKFSSENQERIKGQVDAQQGMIANALSGLGNKDSVDEFSALASNPMQDQGSRFLASFLSSYGSNELGQKQSKFNDALTAGDYETAAKYATSADDREAIQKSMMNNQEMAFKREGLDLQKQELGVNTQLAQQRMGLEGQRIAMDSKKFGLEVQKLQKEIESGGLDANQIFDNTQKLRKEFITSAGDFEKQRDAYGRIQASASEPDAAGDMALIFNYMKLLDPGSTVREGEFATAEQTRGIDQKAVGLYNKLLSGERLTEDQRKAFVGRSGKIYNEAEGQHSKRVGTYSSLAKAANLDPTQVVVDLGIVTPDKIKTFNPATGRIE